jgi:apolipoprotein N-acyltransferase
MPLWLTLELLLVPAIAFTVAVLLFRSFLRRGQVWLAVLAYPSFTVVYEYFTDLMFGTFGNTAYTQLNNLPVLQLAALAGLWGVSFVVTIFAPAAATIILSEGATGRKMALALAGVTVCAVGFGAWRLRATPQTSPTVPVGLVSTGFPKNIFPSDDSQQMQLLKEYAAQVRALAAQGARIVVLPEMTVRVSGSLSDATDNLFEQTARDAGAQVLLGVLHITSAGVYNEARLYSQSGTIEAVYRKRHLVPVAEAGTTPISDTSVLYQPVGPIGLAICRDMDYPDPARNYGRDKVGLLLVPAWDFNVDRWSHGHMAIMRGVEYGFSIVRSAKVGFATVSDDRGRVLAEAGTTPTAPFTTLLATVPVRHDTTLYLRLGDWFAWLNLALFCGLMVPRVVG